ncbi:sigma 54-interacting transcriptional regulator [Enterococcus sp. AZ072]|uniref:sigma 54-interacting transcriptional regulator n=1 Tax=unclassified Enterococcus TaxID=2608891 RepID=UPI003D27A2ED
MNSVENLYKLLLEHLQLVEVVTTQDVEQLTGMKRSVTSLYLNQLADQGRLVKTNTRPVNFRLPSKKGNSFRIFIGYDGSVKNQIEQCKSAVTYPPHGLPILIHGSSGVGKSYLAKLIHQYAIEKKVVTEDAPFVVLNCADYANNKELLSSLLFGYVKGAFSGAEKDTHGLINEAEGGYLFLDEVHNLSAENQEKLFLLIDEKKYRPMGSNAEWQQANVRLIMATTEDPESSLLVTLKRRIPFDVFLPDFSQRSFSEKEKLIFSFLDEERKQLDCSLQVGEDYIIELIQSNYRGNIGEIRNRIKADCAKAYNKAKTDEPLVIGTGHFLSIKEKNKEFTETFQEEETYIGNFGFIGFEEAGQKAQNLIDELYHSYFLNKHFSKRLSYQSDLERYVQKKMALQKYLTSKGVEIEEADLNKIILLAVLLQYDPSSELINIKDGSEARYNYHKFFKLAEGVLQVLFLQNTSINENGLSVLAAYLNRVLEISTKINALIIMHGHKNAQTLANTVNQLVKDFVFESFDLPMDVSAETLIAEVNEYIKKYNTSDGLVLLVDMGSLEQMYQSIQGNVTGDLLIMNNVSTSLALDVGLKLSQRQKITQLEQLALEDFAVSKQYFAGVSQKTNLLISCISGEGIALKIKDILSKYVNTDEIELLSIDYSKLKELLQKDQKTLFKDTVAILTTSPVEKAVVPIINIEGIINGAANLDLLASFFQADELKKCTNEIIKLFTLEGAAARLNFLNPAMVIDEVEEVIEKYEEFYQIHIDNFMRINLFLHLSAMIERILTGDGIDESDEGITALPLYQPFKETSAHFFTAIEQKYKLKIPDGELEMIFLIIQQQL